jgi:hypothetical protein
MPPIFPTFYLGYSWSRAAWIGGFSLQGFKQWRKQHGRCLPQEPA